MALSSTNPLISQGVLNRLLGSIQSYTYPALNITSSFLGKAGISLRRMTDATEAIDTMTGYVASPNPYIRVEVTVDLLRTQNLASQYEAQMQSNTLIGAIVVRSDSSIYPAMPLSNAMLRTVDPFKFDGSDPGYRIMLEGIYYINSSLWN